jgi:hypothetical protein
MQDADALPWTQAATVHQAEGVLSSRLGTDIDQAAQLIRAYPKAAVGPVLIARAPPAVDPAAGSEDWTRTPKEQP